MFSGLLIPFSLTGGARENWFGKILDFDLVVSSQVMALGNIIIKRAAMFTFSPITATSVIWHTYQHTAVALRRYILGSLGYILPTEKAFTKILSVFIGRK